jgi:membrane-associated phospholipid phosphatase
MPLLRESIVWIPLYAFLIAFAYINFDRKGLFWVLGAILTVTLSNYISSDIIKPYYNTPRPCRDAILDTSARLLINRCPGNGSFTSSHAANHFALAMFIYQTLKVVANWSKWFFVWAFAICYAQVYVGVHYPIDVIGGALVGLACGFFISLLFNFKFDLATPKSV